jgi:glycosyltransferase involved in cell wall biosynthesis
LKTISLIHPFTPKAAGVVEAIVPTYHSQPHVKALQNITDVYDCKIEYFTPKWIQYTTTILILKWIFYPVTFKINGDHKKWKKQYSNTCLKTYKRQTPDVTIINMSGQSSKFSYDLSKVILKNNKPYIAMFGGQDYIDSIWIREYYKKAHHILVHTYLQKKMMQEMEMFKNLDIRIFPLGVDCDFFKPIEKQTINTAPKLLYVGKIVEWKRVHLAVEALNKLIKNGFPTATLKIIGPTVSEEYLKKIKIQIKEFKIEKNVFILGQKQHNELPKYFQEADLFLLPSDRETFGMVMIESMACGTPVAGMDCPGGPMDVITNNIDGIISNPENYADEILKLFKNNENIKNLKLNARKTVLEKYSIEETTRVLRKSIDDSFA